MGRKAQSAIITPEMLAQAIALVQTGALTATNTTVKTATAKAVSLPINLPDGAVIDKFKGHLMYYLPARKGANGKEYRQSISAGKVKIMDALEGDVGFEQFLKLARGK